MTSRTHLIAALLTVLGALTGTTALAADTGAVPGNRGPAEKAQNRDAPLTLPGKVAARATPRVDRAALRRGIFDDDLVNGLADLGTVTLGSNGDVVETPASDALRGIFENAVRGHRSGK